VGYAIDEDRVATLEALLREIGDDAALQLAANAVWRKNPRDNELIGRARRRRGRLGCLCASRQP